jgi:hypothetical protein
MALLSAKITTPAQIAQTGGTIPATVKSVKITQPQTTGIVLQSGTTGPAGPTGPAGSTGITGTVRGLYNAGTTYTAGPPPDVVLGSNGHWYVSLTNANIGHDPTTDGGVHWADELPSLVVTSTTALNAVSGLVQVVNATDAAYGAKADAQQATGSITATQNTLTITAGSIPAVGQFVMVPGAGTTGGGVGGPFSAYVSSVASNVVTLVTTRQRARRSRSGRAARRRSTRHWRLVSAFTSLRVPMSGIRRSRQAACISRATGLVGRSSTFRRTSVRLRLPVRDLPARRAR